ncbi:metallophosphoesterase family protein [Halalkalibacillus sediminis]|uniref:metallophosphoesterase family protein n=1 Tax=Halalkalibacillus sediminis TaxID=2018042 RepID=UPI00138FA76F|nr:metallophosphoesterase family protein [Halalkalibacillus sediminis]
MQRTIFISDIHGHLDPFKKLLDQIQYDSSKDQLILVGDYVDRGAQSKETIDFVMSLVEEGAIALKGNHDDWFAKWVRDPFAVSTNFLIHGGVETIESYLGDLSESDFDGGKFKLWSENILETHSHHIEFLEQLPLTYEGDEFIAVHAGVDPDKDDWSESEEQVLLWIRERFIKNDLPHLDKPVIFGHTPTPNLHHSADVYFGKNKIGIDGGYTFGHQLNALILEDGKMKSQALKR